MAKEWAKSFYKSKAWQRCRASYIAERIKTDGGLCECCHTNAGYIVHHKITLTPNNISNPEISLNHQWLSYECKTCHDEHEGHGFGNKKARLLVVFDENGQPQPENIPPKIVFKLILPDRRRQVDLTDRQFYSPPYPLKS